MFIFYDVFFLILFLAYIPALTIKKKWHVGFWQRLGFISFDLKKQLRGDKNIWIHAVSVGEVLAIVDLIENFKKQYPDYKIICSTVTKTGQKIAIERLSQVATVIYAPLDFSWAVHTLIRLIDPRVYISTETEIWPNLYGALHKGQVPIVIINGRISDKSFKGYKRVSFLTKPVLSFVDCFLMQTKLDAERILQLGAPAERVKVIGNIKFDNLPQPDRNALERLSIAKETILIGGSTHPGEEEILLDIYVRLLKDNPELRLILASRHIERTDEVISLVEAKGYATVKFSSVGEVSVDRNAVIVVDKIGELRNLYALASIVFIGKTLKVGGGQNMIEPASLGKAVFVGPLTYNFRDVVDILLKEEAMIQVQTPEELYEKIKEALSRRDILKTLGENARRVVHGYGGATTKTLEIISSFLCTPRFYARHMYRNPIKQFIYEVITGHRKSLGARLAKMALWLLSLVYGLGLWLIKTFYERGILKKKRLPMAVVSVGNLTWGGVGKTPFVEILIEALREKNIKAVILTRGYMTDRKANTEGFSDESQMLKNNLGDVSIVVNKNRYEGGQNFLKDNKADIFILDDGFQHFKLHRDLDIVLVDVTNPWGDEALIPCGILREPVDALFRASVVVLTKTNLDRSNLKMIRNKINLFNPNALIVESEHEPKRLHHLRTEEVLDLNYILGKRIASFCSIGDPDSFTETLKLLETDNAHTFVFMDHHLYSANDVVWINRYLKDNHIKIIVTTQKDQVKLKDLLNHFDDDIVVLALEMKLLIVTGKDALFERVHHLLLR